MYTVLWVDREGNDRWTRCFNRDEVNFLLDQENIRKYDTLIFPHDADDLSINGEEFSSDD